MTQQEFNLTGKPVTLQEKFEAFHQKNPHVYAELVTMAREMAQRRRVIGIGMLFEVLRWNYYMRTQDENSAFKLNNSYRSRYARMITTNNPELRGVFETRGLKTA